MTFKAYPASVASSWPQSNWYNHMDVGARRLLTIREAMREAKVSRRTIYNWIDKGRLDTCRTVGGAVRIFADSLFVPARDRQFGEIGRAAARRVLAS